MADEVTFERIDGESAQAYRAFCAYRDIGVSRSVRAAHKLVTGRDPAFLPGRWNLWAKVNNWVARAELYDVHLERLSRKKNEKVFAQQLIEHRDKQREMAVEIIKASTSMMKKASTRLQKLAAKDIPVTSLPQFFRACAALAEAGTNAEAQSLAVDQMMGAMLGSDESS